MTRALQAADTSGLQREVELGLRGLAVVDFGTSGSFDASVAITGQTLITAQHVALAQLAYVATADHSADEHLLATEDLAILAGPITAGVGFTIYAHAQVELAGKFSVVWSWG